MFLAVLQLKTPIIFNDESKRRICLPDTSKPLVAGSDCYTAGWGHTDYKGRSSEVLRHTHVKIITNEQCNDEKVYNKTIHFTTLCAGFLDKVSGSCNGDSGGALACKKDGKACFYEQVHVLQTIVLFCCK